jgi:hypothetical protein
MTREANIAGWRRRWGKPVLPSAPVSDDDTKPSDAAAAMQREFDERIAAQRARYLRAARLKKHKVRVLELQNIEVKR